MTAFDPESWIKAKAALDAPSLPASPRELDRETRRLLAEQLLEVGWSFRQMASALAIPTTSLHRWLAGEPERRQAAEGRGAGIALVIAAAVCFVIAALGRRKPPGEVTWIRRPRKRG